MTDDSLSDVSGAVNPSSPSATPGRSQPLKLPPLKHRCADPKWIPAEDSVSGFSQTERTCTSCGAVKVTVHGPNDNHYRAWRISADAPQIETFDAPPCIPKVKP